LRAHTEISSSIRLCLFAMVFTPRPWKCFNSMLSKKWVTDLPLGLWQGTPSCSSLCQKNLFHWPIHSDKVAGVFPVLFCIDLGLYCLCPVPKTLITLHSIMLCSMTWMWCFTLSLHADAYEHRAWATAQPWLQWHSQRICACKGSQNSNMNDDIEWRNYRSSGDWRNCFSPDILARLMGQYCFARCGLSASVVVCSTAVADPGARAVGRPTLHGGPVVLRPVRATSCSNYFFSSDL